MEYECENLNFNLYRFDHSNPYIESTTVLSIQLYCDTEIKVLG